MNKKTISMFPAQEEDGSFTVVVLIKDLESLRQCEKAMDFVENALCGDEFYEQ